jgi:hypothetical protein
MPGSTPRIEASAQQFSRLIMPRMMEIIKLQEKPPRFRRKIKNLRNSRKSQNTTKRASTFTKNTDTPLDLYTSQKNMTTQAFNNITKKSNTSSSH